MKHYFLLFIPFFLLTKTYSQIQEGYYITQTNDTVTAQIKVPKAFGGLKLSKLREGIEIVDSNNTEALTTADIKGFGFMYKGKQYTFVSKPVKEGGYNFLEPVIVGQKTSLYQYSEIVSAGMNNTSVHEFYTFEKSDGSYLFMTNFASLDTFREKLSNFYSSSPEVQQLIDTKFSARKKIQKDIKEILEAFNKS